MGGLQWVAPERLSLEYLLARYDFTKGHFCTVAGTPDCGDLASEA